MIRIAAAFTAFAALAAGQEFRIGAKVADFTLADASGASVAYSSLRGETTVAMFVSTQCPISNAYNDRMTQLYNDYAGRGVRFVFINSNRTESAAEVADHRNSNAFPFAVYKDPGNVIADRFGATVTPEVYVMDREGVMRYHGPIDDALNPARVKSHSLREALDAVMAGRQVAKPELRASGCTIKRVPKKTT
jgi:peroxiredoxin